MRFIFFIFVAICSVFCKGISEEKWTNEFRVNLDIDKLLISQDGIFLMTDNFGAVALNDLQFDDRGYFTLCQISYVCANCRREFEHDSKICGACGSEDIVFVEVGECNEYLTAQAILCAFLQNPSLWEDKILVAGQLEVKGGADNKGNQSLTVEVTETTNNGNCSYGGSCSVVKDSDGNTTAKAEATLVIKFK